MKTYIAILGLAVSSANSYAESPLYLQVGVGATSFPEADIGSTDATLKEDGTDMALGLTFGYQLAEAISIEVSYLNHGTYENTLRLNFEPYASGPSSSYKLDATSIALGVRPTFSVSHSTSLDFLLGLHRWELEDVSQSVRYSGGVFQGYGTETNSNSGTDPFFGFGASFSVTEMFEVKPSVIRYEVEGDSIDSFVMGLSYKL